MNVLRAAKEWSAVLNREMIGKAEGVRNPGKAATETNGLMGTVTIFIGF